MRSHEIALWVVLLSATTSQASIDGGATKAAVARSNDVLRNSAQLSLGFPVLPNGSSEAQTTRDVRHVWPALREFKQHNNRDLEQIGDPKLTAHPTGRRENSDLSRKDIELRDRGDQQINSEGELHLAADERRDPDGRERSASESIRFGNESRSDLRAQDTEKGEARAERLRNCPPSPTGRAIGYTNNDKLRGHPDCRATLRALRDDERE